MAQKTSQKHCHLHKEWRTCTCVILVKVQPNRRIATPKDYLVGAMTSNSSSGSGGSRSSSGSSGRRHLKTNFIMLTDVSPVSLLT
jgi:hypothetical protein